MWRPPWPRQVRGEHERFARAVEDGHGPEFSDELAVVAALRRLGADTALDDEARARMAGRIEETRRRPRRRPRALPMVAAAMALLFAVSGLGLLLADDALPGETLYDLKRLRETAVLELTFDDEARALKHLEYAARRIDELTVLVERGELDQRAHAIGLADFTGDTRAGVVRLTALATSSDGRQLASLGDWAARQSNRLAALHAVLPAGTTEPVELLTRVRQRVTALSDRMDCYQITSGEFDDLGALPATGTCGLPERLRTGDYRQPGVAPPAYGPPGRPAVQPLRGTGTATAGPVRTPSPTPPPPPPAPTTSQTAVPPPIPAPTEPRLPDASVPPAPVVSIPPLLPGLPEVSIG